MSVIANPRLLYIPDLCQLVAMVCYEIHEVLIQHFNDLIGNFLSSISLKNNCHVMPKTHVNLAVHSGETIVIPDLHLDLCLCYNCGQHTVPV